MKNIDDMMNEIKKIYPKGEKTAESTLNKIKCKNAEYIQISKRRSRITFKSIILSMGLIIIFAGVFYGGILIGKNTNEYVEPGITVIDKNVRLELASEYFGDDFYDNQVFSTTIHNINKFYIMLSFFYGYDSNNDSIIAFVADNYSTNTSKTLQFYVNGELTDIVYNSNPNTGAFIVENGKVEITVKNVLDGKTYYETSFIIDLSPYDTYINWVKEGRLE